MSEHRSLTNYRSLSSVAKDMLPRAERMHREGMTWRQIARELKISYSALHIWRKLETGEYDFTLTKTSLRSIVEDEKT